MVSTSSLQRGKKRFGHLEKRIGYSFSAFTDLERALTHSSVRKSSADHFHYERLEFLGDRVLGICVAEILYRTYPNAAEGELSLRLNAMVRERTLAEISDELLLHEFIRTGGDLKSITGRRMQSVRADVLEALIASIYLDGGLVAAQEFIERFWAERVFDGTSATPDAKTKLQEWAHSKKHGTPKYTETNRTGPDHDPEFTISVKVGALEACEGKGRSKRLGEQEAAKACLIREKVWDENGNERT